MIQLEITLQKPWEQATFHEVFADLSKIVGLVSEVTEGLLDDRSKITLVLSRHLARHLRATKYNGAQNLFQAMERALFPASLKEGSQSLLEYGEPHNPIARLILLNI